MKTVPDNKNNRTYGSLATNIVRFLLNWCTRYLLAGVVIYSCWIAIENYNYWFSWHVILCTLGIFPLMAEALMLFCTDELWTRQMTRTQKYGIHAGLIILGTILVSVGCILTYYYLTPGYHLYTIHGITGLISMVLFVLSLASGALVNYAKEVSSYPVLIKLIHNVGGLLGYVIGVISLCYAYYTNWFVYYTTEESRILAVVATVVGTLWTLNAAVVSCYNQIKTIFR